MRVEGERLHVSGPVVGRSLATSDRGRLDASGRVHVHGRVDNLINSGGEKIDPCEVERVLAEHPAVLEACVVRVPCARYGQRPAAALVPAPGHPRPKDDELRDHCRRSLAGFKLPDRFAWLDALPRTALGKLARDAVTQRFAAASPAADGDSDGELLGASLRLDGSLGLDESHAREAVDEGAGSAAGAKVLGVHEGLNKLGARPDVALAALAPQGEGPGDRAVAEARHGQLDVDAVIERDRSREIRLGVNDGHRRALDLEHVRDAAAHPAAELLEGFVAQLEHPPEEQDPSLVHLEKARGHAMNERHDDERR